MLDEVDGIYHVTLLCLSLLNVFPTVWCLL